MWNLSYAASHQLARLADLRDDELLVDVGGASGPFAIAALLHRPRLRAVVFDLPPVEPYLRQAGRSHGVADRLDFVPGDFFNDDLPEGDCIAFGYVLSDWTDETCVDLLRKACRACRPSGRVLIMERLFDDDRRGPLATAVMNQPPRDRPAAERRSPGLPLHSTSAGMVERAFVQWCPIARGCRA